MSISYEDHDPTFAANVVNRLVAILEQRFAVIEGDHSRRVRDLLAARHAEVEQRIFQYAEQIKEFQRRYGVLDVETLARAQVTQMAEVGYQLTLKEVQIQTYTEVARIDDRVLALLRAERENLGHAEYQRVLPAQDEIPDLAGEFAQLKLELLVQTEIYKILSQQYELAKLEVEGQEPKLQLLELADESVSNTRPSRRNLAIISFVVSLGIAILVTQVRLSIKRHLGYPLKRTNAVSWRDGSPSRRRGLSEVGRRVSGLVPD